FPGERFFERLTRLDVTADDVPEARENATGGRASLDEHAALMVSNQGTDARWSPHAGSPRAGRRRVLDGETADALRVLTVSPVGRRDGVFVVEDPQAIERLQELVAVVAEVLAFEAPAVLVAMEPLDHEDATRLQRFDDLRGVAGDGRVHVHPHDQIPPFGP